MEPKPAVSTPTVLSPELPIPGESGHVPGIHQSIDKDGNVVTVVVSKEFLVAWTRVVDPVTGTQATAHLNQEGKLVVGVVSECGRVLSESTWRSDKPNNS